MPLPRSASLATQSRKLSLKLKYQRTHRTTISWSKCRPLNSSSVGTNRGIYPSSTVLRAFAPEPEQGLWEGAIDRLPGGAVVSGDANFGVFSVAYAAVQRSHPVLLRLTLARARRLAR